MGTDPIIYFTGRLISRTLHRAKIYVFSRIELCYLLYDSADERNGFPTLALPPPTYRHPPSYVLPKESFLATTAVPPKHRQLLMLPFDFPSLPSSLSFSFACSGFLFLFPPPPLFLIGLVVRICREPEIGAARGCDEATFNFSV